MDSSKILIFVLIGIVLLAALMYLFNHGRHAFTEAWKSSEKDYQKRWVPFIAYSILCIMAGAAVYFFATDVVFTKENRTAHAAIVQHKADLEKIDSMERASVDMQAQIKKLNDDKISISGQLADAKKTLDAKNAERPVAAEAAAVKKTSAPAPKPLVRRTLFRNHPRPRPGGYDNYPVSIPTQVAIVPHVHPRPRPGGFH